MLAGMFSMMGSGTVGPAATAFFSSDPMLSSGWEPVSGPSGFYHAASDKTYVSWQFVGLGGNKGAHVAAYDHTAGSWGERYTAGNFLLADDDHGHPALVRDADGYIHAFYGSHNSQQKWAVTNSPDDISSWTKIGDLGFKLTYPKPVLVGSKLHLFARDGTISTQLKLVYSTLTPVAGVGTWASLATLVDFGADSRVYTTETHVVGTEIHFLCMYTTAADAARKHVYYFVMDTVTGSLSNYNGSTTVLSGSLPVTLAQANTSFRIYDHGSNDGDVPSLQFDTSGNAHVLVADGVTPNYDLKHIMLSGGSWSSPVTVASVADVSPLFGYVGTYSLVPGASGEMEAWYNAASGNKMRRVRSAAGTWAAAETIKAAGALDFVQAAAIRGAHPNLRALFSENSGGATDANAANLGLYAYGDSGPLNDAIDMTAVDPHWSNVTLLLGANHRNNTTSIIDESKSSVPLTFFGNAKIDTAQTPFAGRASLRLDGTGDYLTAPSDSAYSVAGSGDFSLDLWFRMNAVGRLQILANKRTPTTGSEFSLFINATNQLQFIMWGAAGASALNLTSASAMTVGVWRYAEVTRVAGVTYLFLNGALVASGTQSIAPVSNTEPLIIGRDPSNTARDFNGWLAEVRFTKSGRNSAAYTTPAAPPPRR